MITMINLMIIHRHPALLWRFYCVLLKKLVDDDVTLQLLYLTLCAEPETQQSEGATQRKYITVSYESLQRQLKEMNETLVRLTEEVNRLQQLTSELSTVLRRLCNNRRLFVASRNFRKWKFLEEFFNIVRQGIFLQFRSYMWEKMIGYS